MSDNNEIECPKCDHTFGVATKAIIPREQTITWSISYDSTVCSDAISESIKSMSVLLKSIAENAGSKVETFITNMEMKNGTASVEFYIAEIESSP